MKDYYRILGVGNDAPETEIRKAYRRLAFQYHPDRNPGDPSAEDRFKEVAEAYGVLGDPVKRRQYDLSRGRGAHARTSQGPRFQYSRDEIFQDLFRDPNLGRVFQDLHREFQRAGLRFDRHFFDKTFFGGRGVFFTGFFFFGPWTDPVRRSPQDPAAERGDFIHGTRPRPLEALKRLGKKLGQALIGKPKALPRGAGIASDRRLDLVYRLRLTEEEFDKGGAFRIVVHKDGGAEELLVRVPPGMRPGARLRLKGKGKVEGIRRGNLYLSLERR
ncbi:MAG: DnaJ domain-containing protein [Desulfobacteraceae bacterium]